MKKKSLKNLSLNKKSISSLNKDGIAGGQEENAKISEYNLICDHFTLGPVCRSRLCTDARYDINCHDHGNN